MSSEMITAIVFIAVLVTGAMLGAFAEAAFIARLGWASFKRGAVFALVANFIGGTLVLIALSAMIVVLLIALFAGVGFGRTGKPDDDLLNFAGTLGVITPVALVLLRRALLRLLRIARGGCGAWVYALASAIVALIVNAILGGLAWGLSSLVGDLIKR